MTVFAPLPDIKAGAILVDYPSRFKVWSRETGLGRSADRHYGTLTFDIIKTLDVPSIAAKHCVLFLWTTYPKLPEALALIKAWGFIYKTVAFTWVKENRKSPGWFMGGGYWTRSNAEICLLATRGHPKRLSKSVRQLIVAPVREHSRKPDEIYGRIEQLVAGPFVELFARTRRPGWVSWGEEVDKFPAAEIELVAELHRKGIVSPESSVYPLL